MIKFSWKKINNKYSWDIYKVVTYFYLKQQIKVPSFINPKIVENLWKERKCPYISGACFLLYPDRVLENATTPYDLYTYLEVASKRNIFDYMIRGVRHLPIELLEEYELVWVEVNPLLKIENSNVYFKYEQEKPQYEY
jgi:hypothetical protein